MSVLSLALKEGRIHIETLKILLKVPKFQDSITEILSGGLVSLDREVNSLLMSEIEVGRIYHILYDIFGDIAYKNKALEIYGNCSREGIHLKNTLSHGQNLVFFECREALDTGQLINFNDIMNNANAVGIFIELGKRGLNFLDLSYELGIEASTVGTAIGKLETHLGYKLFLREKVSKGGSVTAKGKELFEYLKKVEGIRNRADSELLAKGITIDPCFNDILINIAHSNTGCNRIKAFFIAAECLNFINSGKVLGISQSTVYGHIGNLEKYFGTKLFVGNCYTNKQLTLDGVILKDYLNNFFGDAYYCEGMLDVYDEGNSLWPYKNPLVKIGKEPVTPDVVEGEELMSFDDILSYGTEVMTFMYMVARGLSFSETGRKLNIDQVTVSQRIQRLTDHLGYGIYTKGKRFERVFLTKEGKKLYTYLQRFQNNPTNNVSSGSYPLSFHEERKGVIPGADLLTTQGPEKWISFRSILNNGNRLRMFMKIGESGQNFTVVGKKLGVTQALVSREIGELETYLGYKLFNRSDRSRGPYLTNSGKELYGYVIGVSTYGDVNKVESSFKNTTITPCFNDVLILSATSNRKNNTIEVFFIVAELLNFSKSAELLGTTQGAVSQRIKTIEDYYKTRLFVRNKKPIELTHDGLLLKDYLNNFISYNGGIKCDSKIEI